MGVYRNHPGAYKLDMTPNPLTGEKYGNYYANHVGALTTEDMHSKAEIAAELAYRDLQIDTLRAELANMTQDRDEAQEFMNAAIADRDHYIRERDEARVELEACREALSRRDYDYDQCLKINAHLAQSANEKTVEIERLQDEVAILEDGMTAAHMIGYHSRDSDVKALRAGLAKADGQINRCVDQNKYLESTISRLREYAGHHVTCHRMRAFSEPCGCGYDALLAALEETK